MVYYRRTKWYQDDTEVLLKMRSVNIKLNLMTDGAKFVQIVGAYPYDMDLRSGRHVVDAKSILGIFSLDWSKPVTMEIYSDDCEDLLNEIKPFIA